MVVIAANSKVLTILFNFFAKVLLLQLTFLVQYGSNLFIFSYAHFYFVLLHRLAR